MSFEIKTLGEVCSVGDGAHSKVQRVESGIPYLTSKNIGEGILKLDKLDFISEESFEKLFSKESKATRRPQAGDVLFGIIGSFGNTYRYKESDHFGFSSSIGILRPDPKQLDSEYLYYVVSSKKFRDNHANHNAGSVQGYTNIPTVKGLHIPVPSLNVQRKISQILSSLDYKIQLNTQTNQTLEEMAQAIFKSWFVDFDPVKAKMNGEQPEGMDEATASLFPDKLDSETGIPNGWTQGSIADIAKLNAKSWTKKNSPEQVHYVDLANTKNGVIESVTTYDFEESPSRARRILNSGDTIVGTVRPGNRSYAFIGDTEKPLTGSTGFAVLSPKKSYWTSFVYLATTNDDSIDEYARLADGGAYPAIKPAVVADTQCAIPTEDIAKKFWELTGPMLRKAHQNRLQNEDLAALRDTLLPKLLSGDVKLSDPKVKVGEIG
ncbi:restriction endonuclease subunit S (plasmid) [Shewanella sp. LC6]|uniref:restriction endonuclease subunit S n=1 Tax=unclassified Shewanella TaxID=196818 RepID=UPI00112A21BE|nr:MULTISPECIES: restriction endonuclease subunit S [unclassified Shewanella]QQK62263.1 restriction endonuclease subunit S [Shewanella sp. LC6]TPE55804.1 restriction endonuclease subunit S [Shewanella sp. LC2]